LKLGIITSNDLRHKFFRRLISLHNEVEVVFCICEEDTNSQKNNVLNSRKFSDLEKNHFIERNNSEKDFFECFVSYSKDPLNTKIVKKNLINEDIQLQNYIDNCKPDVIVSYGCSIIREPLLSKYIGKFINIHLGLAPYYKGSGTNYWPLVNNEPEYIGVTYMHINREIDGGNIIHQIRPTIYLNDTIHSIGNRLIKDMSLQLPIVLNNYQNFQTVKQLSNSDNKIYKMKDFSEESILQMQNNFKNGMLKKYLNNKSKRDSLVPIVDNCIIT